jgi:uncharacterized protein
MTQPHFRQAIIDYIRTEAKPRDKFSHQPRLFDLACRLAGGQPFDEDVVFAAAWLHDLGVFIGHRPEDPKALAAWDNVAYALNRVPSLLEEFHFPTAKIPAVVEAIRTHLPTGNPTSFEGTLLRDADILEQLGAVGILRAVSKVGRDTRFIVFVDVLRVLRRCADELPGKLKLESARALVAPRLKILNSFLESAALETGE